MPLPVVAVAEPVRDSATQRRDERMQTAQDAAQADITPVRRRVFTLRRVAIAASLLMVAGVSYEVGTRRESLTPQAATDSPASVAMKAAPREASPSVVEGAADSVAMPSSPLRQRARSGPRNDSDQTVADRNDVASAKAAAPVAASPAPPASPSALSMPLPVVAVAEPVRDSATQRRAEQQEATQALGRVQAREAAGAASPAPSQRATRMGQRPMELSSVVVTGMGAARPPDAERNSVSGAAADASAPKIVTLPGYVTTTEESVPATTRRRYVSPAGTALTLLIVQTPSDARKRAVAADSVPQFTVTALDGRSIVRWHARGMDYELQGALALDSLVKLATQLK